MEERCRGSNIKYIYKKKMGKRRVKKGEKGLEELYQYDVK